MSYPLHEARSTPERRRGDRRRADPAATVQARVPPGDSERTPMSKSLWDALDVARYLKASRNWVYQQADAGKLPSVRMGGLRRFDPDKIRAFGSGEQFAPLALKRK
jgi:excisionase family DNA binding protein